MQRRAVAPGLLGWGTLAGGLISRRAAGSRACRSGFVSTVGPPGGGPDVSRMRARSRREAAWSTRL